MPGFFESFWPDAAPAGPDPLVNMLTANPYATENASALSSGDHTNGVLAAGDAQSISAGYTAFFQFEDAVLSLSHTVVQTLVQAQFAEVLTNKNGLGYAVFVCDSAGSGTGPGGRPAAWSEVGAVMGPAAFVLDTNGVQKDALIMAAAGATDVALSGSASATARRMWMDYQWRDLNKPGCDSQYWRAIWSDETGKYVHTRGDGTVRAFHVNAPLSLGVCVWREGVVVSGGASFALDHLFATVTTEALAIP